MPFVYDVDAARWLVFVRPDYRPTVEEWESLLDDLMAHPHVRSHVYGIIAHSTPLTERPTATEIRRVIDSLDRRRSFFARRRIALVASEIGLYGMGRLAEMLAEIRGLQLRVFEDEAEALDWATGASDSEALTH